MPKPTCSIDDCENGALARGWCPKHYSRWRIHGDPLGGAPFRPKPASPICSVDGCLRPHKGHGYCEAHLEHWKRYGDPLIRAKRWTKGGGVGSCTVRDCEEPAVARNLCASHYARWRRGGDPARPLKKPQNTKLTHDHGEHRTCTACGASKPMAAYYDSPSRPYETRCKDCVRAAVKRYRAANPDKARLWFFRRLDRWIEDVDRTVLFERDRGLCGICGAVVNPQEWDVDHVIPLSRGGEHSYANVQVAHPRCNQIKREKLPHEFIAYLRAHPGAIPGALEILAAKPALLRVA